MVMCRGCLKVPGKLIRLKEHCKKKHKDFYEKHKKK